MMRVFRSLIVIVILLCLAPAFSMLAADIIARIYGCNLDLAATHPCMAGGTDIGGTLMTMGMMGWYLMTTLPVLLATVALWITVEIVRWAVLRSRRA
jgi:hypothetical protein